MIQRLFLGIPFLASPNNKLAAKTKEEPNKHLVNHFLHSISCNCKMLTWPLFLVQLAWWLHRPPGPRSCRRGWRSRSRAPSSTPLPDFVSLLSNSSVLKKWTKNQIDCRGGDTREPWRGLSHLLVPSRNQFFLRWLLSRSDFTCWTITSHHWCYTSTSMMWKSDIWKMVWARLLCGSGVWVSVVPHLRRGRPGGA